MPTEVLYRKWRPQRFADVSGQDVLTRTLVNAIARHKVSHAYLFAGPRGTGKTTTGRLLAKAVNCERNSAGDAHSPGEPCNECPSCVSFIQGRALDLIELDGASNRGIDEIRDLRDNANYAPTGGAAAHKVYLIDEVHMLTDPAFNALLKTLEEPPPHVIFILATTDAHKVPATIVSRCQRHEFKRIPLAAIVDRLAYIAEQEGIDISRDGLEMIARDATGSLRDAINLLEQICDSYGKEPSLEAVRESLGLMADERATELALQAAHGDLSAGLATIGGVRDDGLDLRQFQKEVVMRLREMLLVKSGADTGDALTADQAGAIREGVADVALDALVRALRAFGQADLRADPLSPLPLELALAETIVAPAPAQTAPAQREPQRVAGPTAGAPPAPPPRPRPEPTPKPDPKPEPTRPASKLPPRQAAADRVPEELRRDLSKASAEDIAAMLGSKSPVIPPAGDEPEPQPAPSAKAGDKAAKPAQAAGGNGGVDLSSVVPQLRQMARPRSVKLDALLNGSCEAVSWQDGVLTLGFYEDRFHKKGVEDAQNRRIYEEIASQIFGQPVSIRCIVAPRQAKPMSKSPLVEHAVKTHGAKIVSEDQE